MKVDFYYVRHGQTIFNQIGRMQGSCDSQLTKQGIEDAKEIASVLRNVDFQHAYTSSSERALKTAQVICEYQNVQPICMKELKEFDFGDLDGEPIEKFRAQIWGDRMRDDWTEFHGESTQIFDQRSRNAFDKILQQCSNNDKVLIVSHGSYIMHLMKTLLNFDQEAYVQKRNAQNKPWMPNCGICVFTYEDGNWSMKEEPISAQEFRQNHFPKTIHYYFVTNGQTLFDAQNRLQGQCDSPLTTQGIQHAEQLKEILKDISFQHVFVSTSERTRDTAEIILGNDAYVMDDRLKDINYGELEGSDITDYKEKYVDAGEDRNDVKLRIQQFLRDTIDICEDQENVLVVSHKNIYSLLMKVLDKTTQLQSNVCCFTYENGMWRGI